VPLTAAGANGLFAPSSSFALTQRWALAFADAGFDGIYHLVSHDPSGVEHGIALFGDGSSWPRGIEGTESTPIPDELVAEAQGRFGLLVVPTP
jgi:hypothetical protein